MSLSFFFHCFLISFFSVIFLIKDFNANASPFPFLRIDFSSKKMGSYLFCVNKDDPYDWQWAKPNLHSTDSWAPPDENGFWLNGKLWILNIRQYNAHSALQIRHENERNKREAIYPNRIVTSMPKVTEPNPICTKLVNVCMQSFGMKFSHVGASGYSLAASDWGYIKAGNEICPNWNMPNGFILDTTSGYSIDQLLFELLIDTLTSGPLEIDALPAENMVSSRIASFHSLTSREISREPLDTGNAQPLNELQNANPNNINERPKVKKKNKNEGWTTVRKLVRQSSKDKIASQAQDLIQKLEDNPLAFDNEKRFYNFPVNGKKLLPEKGYYYEFDVISNEHDGRGKRRIVIDKNSRKWWYTDDHYISFSFSYADYEESILQSSTIN